MSRYWNGSTRSIKPYVPGEQPPAGADLIKINTNENPYPPSPKVLEEIAHEIGTDGHRLRLYPNTDAAPVIEAVCKLYNLTRDQVFVGNGSDEVLAFAFRAFWDAERPILTPEISYSFYPVYAALFDTPNTTIPMREDLSIDVNSFVSGRGGVVIANPNAPTSLALPLADIRKILEAHPDDVVLIDEAYVDFGGETAISLIDEFPNLLVVRTLSKSYSLAGLRVGYAVGSPELIDGINRIKNSFNSYSVDRIAMAAGAAALLDTDYFKDTTDRIISTRERTAVSLKEMGFNVLPSGTNFLFASHPKHSAAEMFEHLKKRGILVRYFAAPNIANYLRISIGTDPEMDQLISVLGEMM